MKQANICSKNGVTESLLFRNLRYNMNQGEQSPVKRSIRFSLKGARGSPPGDGQN